MNNKNKFNLFFKLTSVDEEKRLVYGRATEEIPDGGKEIMDYASSKPLIQKWSEAAMQRTQAVVDRFGEEARSLGNVRIQHSEDIGGKVIDINFNDAEKAVDLGTYCYDDKAWDMIKKGLLTGFSVGGNYAKQWRDQRNPNYIRYTADPVEFSYVDSPAVKTAMFTMIKSDGSRQLMKATNLGSNPADSENLENNEVQNPSDPDLVQVPSDEVVKEIPVIAGTHLSPNLIETNGVKEISAPPQEVVRKEVNSELLEKFIASVAKLEEMKNTEATEKLAKVNELKSLGARVGIIRRESAPLTAPNGFPTASHDYGDPVNFNFPLDKANSSFSVTSFNKGSLKKSYLESEWHTIGRRIVKGASRFGVTYSYNPQKQEIEVQKMGQLSKVDAQNLLNQLSAALGVAADQIAADPAAVADMLMAALGSTDSADSDIQAGTPTAPMGSQASAADVTLKAASTMSTASTPESTPSSPASSPSSLEAAAAPTSTPSSPSSPEMTVTKAMFDEFQKNQSLLVASMAEIVKVLGGGGEIAEVHKSAGGMPLGDLANFNINQPDAGDEPDPVLEALTDGSAYALRKAATILGTEKHPDVSGVIQKANKAAMNSLIGNRRFTDYYSQIYPGMFRGGQVEA